MASASITFRNSSTLDGSISASTTMAMASEVTAIRAAPPRTAAIAGRPVRASACADSTKIDARSDERSIASARVPRKRKIASPQLLQQLGISYTLPAVRYCNIVDSSAVPVVLYLMRLVRDQYRV